MLIIFFVNLNIFIEIFYIIILNFDFLLLSVHALNLTSWIVYIFFIISRALLETISCPKLLVIY